MKLVHLLKKCDNLNESKKVYECSECNKRFACIRSGGLELQNFQQTQNLIRITKL